MGQWVVSFKVCGCSPRCVHGSRTCSWVGNRWDWRGRKCAINQRQVIAWAMSWSVDGDPWVQLNSNNFGWRGKAFHNQPCNGTTAWRITWHGSWDMSWSVQSILRSRWRSKEFNNQPIELVDVFEGNLGCHWDHAAGKFTIHQAVKECTLTIAWMTRDFRSSLESSMKSAVVSDLCRHCQWFQMKAARNSTINRWHGWVNCLEEILEHCQDLSDENERGGKCTICYQQAWRGRKLHNQSLQWENVLGECL